KLALYCLGAVDAPEDLIEVLGKQDQRLAPERGVAIFVLRRWLSWGGKQHTRLYDEKKGTGLLTTKYTGKVPETIGGLRHDFSEKDRANPDTFEALANSLESTNVAVAELAYFHLQGLSRGVKLPRFNAADSLEDRKAVAEEVRGLIEKKQLPPPPPSREEPAPKEGDKRE